MGYKNFKRSGHTEHDDRIAYGRRKPTWNVIPKSDGQEGDEGEIETVEVCPPVLNVPKDDGRENHEDDEAGKEVCKNLTAKYRQMFQVSTALGYLPCDLWKLKEEMKTF